MRIVAPTNDLRINNGWEIAAGLTALPPVSGSRRWLVLRRRPTPEEIERARRQFLVQSGRIVDGMLLDVYEVEAEDGRTLTMLLFSYRIGGVDYECSQDITAMLGRASTQPRCAPDFPAPCATSPATRKTASWSPKAGPACAKACRNSLLSKTRPLDRSHLEPGAR